METSDLIYFIFEQIALNQGGIHNRSSLMMKGSRADIALYGWLIVFALVNAVVVKVHLRTLQFFDLPIADTNATGIASSSTLW